MRALFLFLVMAAATSAQNYATDEVAQNPARFRQVVWDDTFTVTGDGDYQLGFPANISTYRAPTCIYSEVPERGPAVGGSARLEWVKVSRSLVIFKAPKGETIAVHCIGYEIKPWRKDDVNGLPKGVSKDAKIPLPTR